MLVPSDAVATMPLADLRKVYKSIGAAVVDPLVEPHDHKTHQAGASTATHCC